MARWIRFSHAGAPGFGTLEGDEVHVFEGDMFAAPRATGTVLRRADVALLRPCEPGKIIVMYNNFGALVQRLKQRAPAEPQYLLKPTTACADPGATVQRPSFDSRIVFEGELGIVIGRACKGVDEAQAMAHVFGYTCANDLTATDVLTRDPAFAHWARAKGFDGSCPFGPTIATGLDPATLVVRTRLDGRVRQEYPVSDMLFSVAQLVSRISHDMSLLPGDLVLCGTSVGVGVVHAGCTVEVEIAGIGTLANRFE